MRQRWPQACPHVGLTAADVAAAEQRLARFAPYLAAAFPETQPTEGIIESELVAIPAMQQALDRRYGLQLGGKLLLKKDSHLPISGSIMARGGIYEVLTHAETLALEAGLLQTGDDYTRLFSDEFRQFFSQYRIAVGSTGNLGLSIGIISARLGFDVSAYVGGCAGVEEAKAARKRRHGGGVRRRLRRGGRAGRKQAANDPRCFFIDDENSQTLFLGYAVAGGRLKRQFAEQGIVVDAQHPLFVYLPCGVGGGPGGVAFGSSWRSAITFTVFSPNRPIRPACCSASTAGCMTALRCKIRHRQPHRGGRAGGGARLRLCRPGDGAPAERVLHPER